MLVTTNYKFKRYHQLIELPAMQMRVSVEGSQGSLAGFGRRKPRCVLALVGGRRRFGLIFVAAKFEGDGLTDGQEILA